jgi:hypothetical protein
MTARTSTSTPARSTPRSHPLLVAAAEEHARAQAEKPILRGFVQGDEPILRDVYAAAGWRPIRYSFQMRIDLDREIPAPTWPDGLEPRNFEPREDERVYEAHMDSFSDHWDFRRQSMEAVASLHRRPPRLRPVTLVAGRGRPGARCDLAQRMALLR